MVSSEHGNKSGVPKLVGEKKSDDLHVILISVDIISLEQILFMRGWPNLVEKTYKVLQLPMNIA
jgi:hypothetical protein